MEIVDTETGEVTQLESQDEQLELFGTELVELNENSLYSKVLTNLKIKKQRVLDGKLNCIPFNLGEFRREVQELKKNN